MKPFSRTTLNDSGVLKNMQKGKLNGFQKNGPLFLMTLPMVIYIFVFNYIPMAGIFLSFKRFRYDKGFWGSEWIGFDNFKFFFQSQDAWRTARNTLAYNFVFIIIGVVIAVGIALLLYEISNRKMLKMYQTIMFFPHLLSWVVISFMAYAFLNSRSGLLNMLLKSIHLKPVDWYNQPNPWIFIFPIAHIWKSVGMSALIYYASLIGIDHEYFEAASIEGANKWHITTKITLPFLKPLITILTILAIGQIFNADFGLFYQLPMNSPMLYKTTDVIETYIFRTLREEGNIGVSSAVGLFKSLVGLVLVITTNAFVKRVSPENALF
ncbi:MAG: ABC transporter permease subunit [Firmicutes bacterium]|nr:ABC transporter permease subunit [Bacillota bacterium]